MGPALTCVGACFVSGASSGPALDARGTPPLGPTPAVRARSTPRAGKSSGDPATGETGLACTCLPRGAGGLRRGHCIWIDPWEPSHLLIQPLQLNRWDKPARVAGAGTSSQLCVRGVLVSCPHEAPHTGWLETTEMCSLTVLGAGSLKSGCQQGCVPSEICRGGSFLPLPASGAGRRLRSWRSAALLRSPPPLSHGSGILSACLSPLLIRRPVILA